MGRLRNKRRGGGAGKTVSGLTRTGTALKLVGSKGGIQNPIVGEAENGVLFEVFHNTGTTPKTTPLPKTRTTAIFLAGLDTHHGGPFPAPATHVECHFAHKADNVITWSAGADVTYTFWVF